MCLVAQVVHALDAQRCGQRRILKARDHRELLAIVRLRRMKFVREQFFLAAAAQNIKRLVRFLSQAPIPPAAATA